MYSGEGNGQRSARSEQSGHEHWQGTQLAAGAENTMFQQESPDLRINEISGGRHKLTIQGGHYEQFVQKQVNKTYHTDPTTGNTLPAEQGVFRISSLMSVLEKKPISRSSNVFHGIRHSKVTGDKKVVVKIIPADEKHQREAKIHFSVPHHKNIVERFLTDTFNYRGQPSLYIAMERCDCSLHDYIKSQKEDGIPFDSQKYLSISHQIVVALEFLHSCDVTHSDLKPTNVLLNTSQNLAKLSDFGLSRSCDDSTSTQRSTPHGGTTGWLAPEVLKGVTRIGHEIDIFPLGLICYYAWSYGEHPYGAVPYSRNHYIAEGSHQNIESMLIPNADSVKVLVQSMLEHNPGTRPTAKQVLEHEIFTSQRLLCLNRANDAQLEDVVHKAFRAMSRSGPCESDYEVSPFGFTVVQLSNAMKRVQDRSRSEVSTVSAGLCYDGVPTLAAEDVNQKN